MAHSDKGLCDNCIYGSQPHGYFPIICVYGKRINELWQDKTDCQHFERCPEQRKQQNKKKQEPFKVITLKDFEL